MSETWVVSMFTTGRGTAILPPLPSGGNRYKGKAAIPGFRERAAA
jgi:hypothetical protein